MGGLGGHMAHPYENMELTFGQLKSMFWLASNGKLRNTSEKLDGQNVFFAYDRNGLRFARNVTDIKTGGMTYNDIVVKWGDSIPHVATAFCKAYDILSHAFSSLSIHDRNAIFGIDELIWYSAELLFSETRNVYHYDSDSIVFHESGTIYDNDGKPMSINTESNFACLLDNVTNMQKSVGTGTIRGPSYISMSKTLDEYSLRAAFINLDKIMNRHCLDNDNPIKDMVVDYIVDNKLNSVDADYDTKLYIAEQLVEFEEAINPRKNELKTLVEKQLLTKEDMKVISPLFKQMPKLYMEVIEPIRKVVRDFGIALLKLYQSDLINDPNQEIKRLQGDFTAVRKQIKISGTDQQRNIFLKEHARLESLNNISSSMEGIVFQFDGKTYKFTGAFGPLNTILGIFRYSR